MGSAWAHEHNIAKDRSADDLPFASESGIGFYSPFLVCRIILRTFETSDAHAHVYKCTFDCSGLVLAVRTPSRSSKLSSPSSSSSKAGLIACLVRVLQIILTYAWKTWIIAVYTHKRPTLISLQQLQLQYNNSWSIHLSVHPSSSERPRVGVVNERSPRLYLPAIKCWRAMTRA